MATPSAPLVAILGPTASGKSALAVDMAEHFGGEIVSCDSLQVFRFFDIGTAKSTAGERRSIPHHLIDIVNPDQTFTAGDYARAGRAAITDISTRGRLPIVTGGTGFYLRALLEGLFPGPERDPHLRQKLAARETGRKGVLHRWLRRLDPAAAARIHPHDINKLIRAIEVCITARRPMTDQLSQGRNALAGYRVLKIVLDPPRAELYKRIDERVIHMFESGLLEEVRGILAAGFPRSAKPLESLGYKEALGVIDGRLTTAEAIAVAQKETRQYAKRQLTWFRREPAAHWFHGFGDHPQVREAVLQRIAAEL